MTGGKISRRVVADRLRWVESMIGEIRRLPLHDRDLFFADSRNVWTAESCLRRSLEALLDLGRHVLVKGFALGVSEYKEIARCLVDKGVLDGSDGDTLAMLAGYRNRLVHFYHEVSKEELFQVCSEHLSDIDRVLTGIKQWLSAHPECQERTL